MFYHKLGIIPQKRHTQFRKPDGSLYREELISTQGFDGIMSNVYHINIPPKMKKIDTVSEAVSPDEWQNFPLQPYHFKTKEIKNTADYIFGRKYLFFNDTVKISLCFPLKENNCFYRNGSCDELVFVHEGEGTLQTFLGNLPFKKGDYILIPRGVLFKFTYTKPSRFLIIESYGPVVVPKRYRNEFGQFLEHSPFCERDIRIPLDLQTIDEKGNYTVKVKKHDTVYTYHYEFHPFDIVGWDGYYYPYIFNIDDFMPITGKIHQPPTVHQTFDGPGFVVCSFVSRLLDYHPLAISVPYNHSNLDCDEVLYYADGQFSSRKGIEYGSVSFHPSSIPHGPHPGRVEAALGKKETVETAVMIDTFKPLKLTGFSRTVMDKDYPMSWNE